MISGLSAHLNTLYVDVDEVDRCTAAADDGFRCVEMWAPPPSDIRGQVISNIETLGLHVASVNTRQGKKPNDFGLISEPSAVDWWKADLRATLSFARQVNARAVNVLVGGRSPTATKATQRSCLLTNLDWAVSQLGRGDPVLLLEPLNGADRQSPMIHRVEDALALMVELDDPPSLQLLFDAYHLFQEEETLIGALDLAASRIGHVQLADYPGRGEPGTGEIPFQLFLPELSKTEYAGWLGLEYFPQARGADRFAWVREHTELQHHLLRSVSL